MEEKTTVLYNEFLDLEVNEHLPIFREEHKKEYEIIFKLVDLFKDIKDSFVGKTIPQKDLLLMSAIIELNKLFQSAVLLFERGLPESANIIIRTILEVTFNVFDGINNDEHMQQVINKEHNETKRTRNIIKDYKMSKFLPFENDEEQKEINGNRNKKNNSFKSAKQLADTNDLKQEYLLYRTYSSETHMSLSVLTQNFETTPLGVYFDADFRIDNFRDNICILISVVIRPLEFFLENYCEDNTLKTKFYEFMGNYVETFK